jgi:carbamoyl-phosphate synthase large subunit
MLGEKVAKIDISSFDLDYVGVKASQFSFTRLKGSDPVTGVEMSSTGEVACLGDDFNEAFLKSLLSTGYRIPKKGIMLSTGILKSKTELIDELLFMQKKGYKFYGTKGTADFYKLSGIEVEPLYRSFENKEPSILTYMAEGKIDMVINIPKTNEKLELDNDYIIRRKAIDLNIPLFTNVQFAKRFFKTLKYYTEDGLKIKSWDEYN